MIHSESPSPRVPQHFHEVLSFMQLCTRVFATISLCFLALGTMATAQNPYVILYPGASSQSTNLQVFLPIPGGLLARGAPAPLPLGTFKILLNPTATKYFVIATGGTAVSVMDTNFLTIVPIATAITGVPTSAVLTPDGNKLLVTAGNALYVIDTATGNLISPAGGLALPAPGVDIVVSFDSLKAYVLTASTTPDNLGTVVTAVDLSGTTPVLTGLTFKRPNDVTHPPTGLVLAPSGLLYLSTLFYVLEIDPATLTLTPQGQIGVNNIYPGKPVITPDGTYLVVPNLTPTVSNSLLAEINLSTKAVSQAQGSTDTLNAFFSRGVDASGANKFYATGLSGQVYDVTLGSTPIVELGTGAHGSLQFLDSHGYSGVQFSSEIPPKLMWVTFTDASGQNYLEQIDIAGQVFSPVKIASGSTKLDYISPTPSSGGTVLTGFNLTQTVAAGQKAPLPLVARLTDPTGAGVYHGSILFDSVFPDMRNGIATKSFTTGSGGYAFTYVTAPIVPGTYTITADANLGTPITYTIIVPGSNGGVGGGGTSKGGLISIAGNGGLTKENFPLKVPLTVRALDANGKPISGELITWTATSQLGANSCNPTLTDVNGYATCAAAGVNGVAAANYAFVLATVQATDPAGNVVTFTYTTVASLTLNGTSLPDPTFADCISVPQAAGCGPRVIVSPAGSTLSGAYTASIAISGGPFQSTPLPGVSVFFSTTDVNNADISSGQVTLTDILKCANDPVTKLPPVTDARGVLTCDLQVGGQLISGMAIFPLLGGLQQMPAVIVSITPGAPAKVTVNPLSNKQSGKPGQQLALPLLVSVTDSSGNLRQGIPVTWSVTPPGSATVSSPVTTSDVNGVTSVTVKLGSTPGPIQIKASVNTDVFALFDATIVATAGSFTLVSGDNQSTFANSAFPNPVVVILRDQLGFPLPNTTVSFSATGGATVNPTSVVTAADGTASTRVTAGALTGPVTVNAVASGFSVTLSNLTVKVAGPQVTAASFLNGASFLPGLTPCGLGVIQGTGIAPGVAGTVQPSGFGPNPTSLGPVQSLTIAGIATPLTFVSNIGGVERVGFQTPCDLPVGTASVTMNVSGGTTTVDAVPVLAFSPGMFESIAADGNSYAVALRSDGSFISPSNPARRGEIIRVFVTGLGQTSPPISTNSAGIGGQTVNATIIGGVNNAGVLVNKAEYVAGKIGTYFVDMTIPFDTPVGPYQPIAVAVQPPGGGDLIFGNGVYIPIQ